MDTRLASPTSLPSWQWYWSIQILATVQATTGRGTASTWPAADRAIFIPVMCAGYFTVKKFAIENAAVSGNVDVGLYTSEGKLVISTGSTAMSGANAWQEIDVTDTQIPPGLYYLAMAINNTTGANSAAAFGLQQMRAQGAVQMASAFPLPATATFAAVASNYWPSFQAMGVDTI